MSAFQFQVDLRSIIELLSSHLYSGPQVFVRELLQNGIDAIRARQMLDSSLRDKIELELSRTADGTVTLMVADNGVGLTEDEVHRLLATIGSSSKRENIEAQRSNYIGQFGIGLLSCFIVTDEIVVVSQSAKPSSRPVEWCGKSDGTYSLKLLEGNVAIGTRVYLRANKAKADFFEFDTLLGHAKNYGSLLPVPISLAEGNRMEQINIVPPWGQQYENEAARRAAYMGYGTEIFGLQILDFVPLHDANTGCEGAAYILSYSPSPSSRKANRIYLKGMLITDHSDAALPEWAFFVKCVVNTKTLTPTASRESIYDNAALAALRDAMGANLKEYIVRLANYEPERLNRFLALHHLAIKQLATFDDDLLLLFIDHLQFETSMGDMTLPECREHVVQLGYAASVDDYKQIAGIAAAQGIGLVNAGYVYDRELLERYSSLRPELAIRPISVNEFVQALEELKVSERETFFDLLQKADRVLQPFHVQANIRHFEPKHLPVLYVSSSEASQRRSAEQARETSSKEWGSVLDNIFNKKATEDYPELCFNASNGLVQRLSAQARTGKAAELGHILELLYVQALLFGRRPLNANEMTKLNEGILYLVDKALGSDTEIK